MKLDKIRFAMLINWLSRNGLHELAGSEIQELDDMINVDVPPAPMMNAEQLHVLMALMQEGTRKIEAIKQHRIMTGYGLKESKDAVEKYWNNGPDAKLLARIRQALGTVADGDELVDAAKNAHRASEELASQHNAD